MGYRFLLVLSDSWLHVLTSWFDPSDTARLYLRPSVISWLYAYNLLEVIQTTEPHFELLQQKSCKTDFLCVVFLVCLYVHTQIYVYMCNLVCYKFEIFKSEVWQVLVYLCLLCSWTVTYTVCSSVIKKIYKIQSKDYRTYCSVKNKTKWVKDFTKEDEHCLFSLKNGGVSLPQLSFIQHSALLSSFPSKQKLPRYSPESGIELY